MIAELAELIREAFALTVVGLAPLWVAAAAVAILVGLLGAALGIRDGALAQIARALAVVVALALLGRGLASATLDFAVHSWTAMGEDPESSR